MVNATNLRYLYLQKEQAVFIANSRCKVRVPGIGNHDMPRDSRTKLQEYGYQRSKFNWYQLAADYFKYRDPFALPADGGVPYACYDGSEPGCDGRTQCKPGLDNSCPGLDEQGMPRMYSLSTTGDRGGDMFKQRWAGVIYCVEPFDAAQTFLRLCEMEGDCDPDGYSTATDPAAAGYEGTTDSASDSSDGVETHHMPETDGGAEDPMG